MNVTLVQVKRAIQNILAKPGHITSTTDIRELSYQGKAFAYPCVRYEVETCEPDECNDYRVLFNVYCWSEEESSLQATQITDQVVAALHRHIEAANPIRLQMIYVLGVPSVVRDGVLWRGEVYCKCLATT